ncbi:MAG TPA: class I SAM-dependent methyltransferase [Terriglobales bacterium]|nr:class I SAM-dependent methyltransferase [Terriglobales bacterium]
MPTENSQFAKTEVSGVFDRMASYYAGERGQSPWFQAQLKIVLQMLDSERGLILDIGCAAGAEFEPLLARGFHIVGLDYSPEMLRLAGQRFSTSPGVHLCRADAEGLPFPDASFDHVVCLGVFEYLSTYDRCLEEIHRVLRPGGVAIISLPTSISLDRFSNNLFNITAVPLWRAIRKLMGKRTSSQPVGRRWNRCIPWQVPARLRKHGLDPEDSAYSGFLLFPLGQLWPAAEYRLFLLMERFSKSRILGWTLSQYLVSARKTGPG